ncbi:hypothetical protein BJ138DRAFT_335979 [Hygrophoropsis aurantiaca]|uniref:Uncharacterized protein n=1 Tax=Hygrophoropsis aurantiaca TaxID=72124 RepID=A0ACB8ANY8_9AGAM|nr:hypothetical protein BJ138DRAFT_335979 [Hygrophoropsis aurantiaca]
MSTVEAAASLFGADGDSGPDPFAVIGNEETDTTPLPESNVNGHEGIDSFSYSHNMGQDASNLFGAEAVHSQGSQDSTWSLQPDYSSSDCPQVVGAESSNYERTQEWHTNSVQGSTHGENFVPNTTSVQEVYNAYTPSSAYESYAPAYNSALYQPPVVTQYSASQYEPAHSSYDPYKPATNATHVSLSHQPAASPYTPAVYDQYTPSVNHSYGTPSYATAPNPLPNTTVAHPPPPAPVVSASTFRPKTSNAYDPPLPPPKASKRVVSARAPRTVSPAIDPQTYPPPKQQPALSPHPPPPPPASSFSSMHPPQPPKLTHDSSTASYRAQNSYSPSGYSRLPEQHTQSIYGGPPSHNATNMHNGIDGAVDFYEVGLAPAMSAQPSHQMPLITPPRSSPSREMLEEAPTPRATPSGMFSDSVYVEETSTAQQSYSNSEFNDFRGNTPNSVHDNMSWDDPEGGLDDYPSFSNNAEESSRSYSPYKPNREGAPSPKPSSPSPPANDVKDVYSNRYSSSSFDRPSSPAKPTYHRENSLINGNGSSRPPSVHSRTGSYGSGVSPRSPVPRVSSPLRDNTISAAQISYPPPSNIQSSFPKNCFIDLSSIRAQFPASNWSQ